MDLTVLVGNPQSGSRTLDLALRVADALTGDRASRGADRTVIDLAEHADQVLRWPSDSMDGLLARVRESHLLVVASPTYKAAYTGLLKAFLDRLGHRALNGVVAVPVMTGASELHAMTPELTLRPLLSELGAIVPCHSLYLNMQQHDAVTELVATWSETNRPPVDAVLAAIRA